MKATIIRIWSNYSMPNETTISLEDENKKICTIDGRCVNVPLRIGQSGNLVYREYEHGSRFFLDKEWEEK